MGVTPEQEFGEAFGLARAKLCLAKDEHCGNSLSRIKIYTAYECRRFCKSGLFEELNSMKRALQVVCDLDTTANEVLLCALRLPCAQRGVSPSGINLKAD